MLKYKEEEGAWVSLFLLYFLEKKKYLLLIIHTNPSSYLPPLHREGKALPITFRLSKVSIQGEQVLKKTVQAVAISELEFHVHGLCHCRWCPFKIQNIRMRFRYVRSDLTPCEFDLDFKILCQRSMTNMKQTNTIMYLP